MSILIAIFLTALVAAILAMLLAVKFVIWAMPVLILLVVLICIKKIFS